MPCCAAFCTLISTLVDSPLQCCTILPCFCCKLPYPHPTNELCSLVGRNYIKCSALYKEVNHVSATTSSVLLSSAFACLIPQQRLRLSQALSQVRWGQSAHVITETVVVSKIKSVTRFVCLANALVLMQVGHTAQAQGARHSHHQCLRCG